MITLYGHPMSRAHRVMWMLRELDIPFRHEPTDFLHGGNKTPGFLRLNPNGKVPVLNHDGTIIFESFAINLYLSRAFPSELSPQNQREDALTLQWCFWAVNEIEKTLFVACENLFLFPADKRRPNEARLALEKLDRPMKVLDAHLAGNEYLLGPRFKVPDLAIAGMMTLIPIAKVDISAYPHVTRWLADCLKRPAGDDYKPIKFTVPRPATEDAWMQSLM